MGVITHTYLRLLTQWRKHESEPKENWRDSFQKNRQSWNCPKQDQERASFRQMAARSSASQSQIGIRRRYVKRISM
jgi:hypothetical protein